MKIKLIFFSLLFVQLFVFGCVTTGVMTPIGFSAVNISTQSGGLGVDRGIEEKTGESCSHNILGIVAFGDSSISSAKKQGGIEKVSYFDMEIVNVLGAYGKVCTIVKGI